MVEYPLAETEAVGLRKGNYPVGRRADAPFSPDIQPGHAVAADQRPIDQALKPFRRGRVVAGAAPFPFPGTMSSVRIHAENR